MAGKSSQPRFLWQAVLILLPVVVLSVIGWASLRQDKALAENDARERAQAVADQLVPTLWNQLTTPADSGSSNEVAFRVDEFGQLIFPPPADSTPAPQPFSPTELSPEQLRLWTRSQSTAVGSLADGTAACKSFIDSKPPERFAAAAQYQFGLLLLRQKNWSEAIEALDLVAHRFPDAVGESGLPLAPLAQIKILELEPPTSSTPQFKVNVSSRGTAEQNGMSMPDVLIDAKHFIPLDSFCSNIVYHPTLLTPFLLGQLLNQTNRSAQSETVHKWQATWEDHERARHLFAAARDRFRADAVGPLLSVGTNSFNTSTNASVFWFRVSDRWSDRVAAGLGGRATASEENWIGIRADQGTNRAWFVCRPESDIGTRLAKASEFLPAYFGVGVEVAGKRIIEGAPLLNAWRNDLVPGGKGGGQQWEKKYSGKVATNLLATAEHVENGTEQLKISVYLTSPDELFASQKSRVLLFGLLVIASALAALIGLFAAWRAFHRQLRLAEMKSNFVSSVSHELRAPIASVRLMAESLERGKVAGGEKQNEYFRFIVQECRRLSSLIENVLDFSRIEQGRKQYEFEPTDLLALTRETVKLMEPYAEEKGVQLKFETFNIQHSTPNLELDVDGRAIQQALVNLIDNAIKHSAKGQTVTIGVDAAERASGVPPDTRAQPNTATATDARNENSDTNRMPVLLYVEDHGAGIPPAEHEKIFERFYRLGSELRRETQGVGIGLSIVRHIVAAHGGKVTVRSSLGQGSRFTIVLPGVNAKTQSDKGAKEL